MPRKYQMSWDRHQARWTKMYKGQRYVVSCYALGAPTTKEGSSEKANDWWRAKQAEIDGRSLQPAPGSPAAAKALLDAWAGQPLESEEEVAAAVMDLMSHYEDRPLPDVVQKALVGPEKLAAIKAGVDALIDGPQVPHDRTIGRLVDTWVETEFQRVRTGKLGLSRANMNKLCLHHFRDWIGEDAPVNCINEEKWLAWFTFLSGKVTNGTWAESHCDRLFAVSRRFVRFLWEMRLIELPRNLDNRMLAFSSGPKKIELYSVEEVQKLYSKATGQTRLHILLMLNCGFIGQDVSDLQQDQVDWNSGIITRKRSKTRKKGDVPVVRYKLWDRTFHLLKQFRSDDPVRVLLTTSGRQWIEESHDGQYHRSDKVASCLKYWLKRAGVKHPPKALRATAATMLGEHSQYKFYAQYFLGQSPRTIADKHYVRPSDNEFFEALAWLEKALGFTG